MINVTSVSLADLKIYEDWKYAPVGALLQARDPKDSVLVGMRCEINVRGGPPHPCFLILSGERRGQLLEDGALHRAALDVSSMLEIRIKDPSPVAFSEAHHQRFGIVCEHGAGSGHLFIRAEFQSKMRVYVWLADPKGVDHMGSVITDAPPNLFVLGISDVFEKTKPIVTISS